VGGWSTAGLVAIIFAVALVLIFIAGLPGLIAERRRHPNANAIIVCGLVGILIWPAWIVAFIWAFTGPDRSKPQPVAPRPAPRGLTCDGCGRPLAIAQARQIGERLICPACASALDGGSPYAPKAEQLFDPAEEIQGLDARSRRERRPSAPN